MTQNNEVMVVVMNKRQIREFKTAFSIVTTLTRPTDTATQDEWDIFDTIYNNAQDTIWKYSEVVMKCDGEWDLKNLMEDWAYDCEMFWNGTKFTNLE